MKHRLRKEIDCLNCGAEVTDRFCPHCGQENLETKESFGHLLSHFFADITHYDSKFFTTIKDLLFKPGFLTKQYFEGKRTKYLNPVRMYFFISFIFFLVIFLGKKDDADNSETYNPQYENIIKQHIADSLRATIKQLNRGDDSIKASLLNQLASNFDTAGKQRDTTEALAFKLGEDGLKITLTENKFHTVHDYDSAQQVLPENKRDNAFLQWILRTNINLKNKYGKRSEVVVAQNFEHSIPKLMFVLLPLFAWFIYILHSRKKFYYAQHAIFSIYFHSFIFLLLLAVTLVNWLPFMRSFDTVIFLISYLLIFIYLVFALKNTYQQSLFIAVLKAFLICLLYIIALIPGIFGLMLISFVTA